MWGVTQAHSSLQVFRSTVSGMLPILSRETVTTYFRERVRVGRSRMIELTGQRSKLTGRLNNFMPCNHVYVRGGLSLEAGIWFYGTSE